MCADKLPFLVHFDWQTRQVAKVNIHVSRKRFAGFTNDALDRVFARLEHASTRANRHAFAERRENRGLFFYGKSVVHTIITCRFAPVNDGAVQ